MKATILTLKDLEADDDKEIVLLQTEMTFMGRKIFLESNHMNRNSDVIAIKSFKSRFAPFGCGSE